MKPTDPTTASAGSAEKIEVLKNRRAQGVPLFHADDTLTKVDQRPDPEPPLLFAQLSQLEAYANA